MTFAHICSICGLSLCFVANSALSEIALFEDDNYGGRTYRSSAPVPNLGDTDFNDKASSVIVRGRSWQLCDDADYRGHCVTLDPGEYPSLRTMGLNDKVSSVRAIGGPGAPGSGSGGGSRGAGNAWAGGGSGGGSPGGNAWGGSGGPNAWGGGAPVPPATVRLEGKENGHCRLINVAYGREMYNGMCTIKQTVDANRMRFAIRVGANDPFVFVKQGSDWVYNAKNGASQPARFKDMGHSAVFRWDDYRLEVDEDL